jgi:hypothetical protein
MRTDGRTDMTKLIVAFRCFANVPNYYPKQYSRCAILVYFLYDINRFLKWIWCLVQLGFPCQNFVLTCLLKQFLIHEWQLFAFVFPSTFFIQGFHYGVRKRCASLHRPAFICTLTELLFQNTAFHSPSITTFSSALSQLSLTLAISHWQTRIQTRTKQVTMNTTSF